ncbi:bifunctional DNA-formamidopyrimidine glycosylase/DNA-(apurinic or apyrimidinic site) lyase [Actinomyces weissii]|uniref:Bifunctional DNA-formamidopyrimidine glycosylase/DNA-(Apurinic or apyrimidinic site) lyase n=1 Tax=Actinomyces weissii TaxID=675090 RepID=A0A7T7M8B4_9ACTO|nr:bifunctional DNA-formamidopyrimidine glycosylase/DNA-(apurinic or apyrimidinic site) lyase [Actinomyces weissii]QQM66740.1 bifunctional DNA-formamidopyrimidine glycosylase/DNA-(apurinic or apyrimidinic site) lyase [Actinomyces weissii]
MPELPEVESVRLGLERHLRGRVVQRVEVLDPRPLRRQAGGEQAFVKELTGRTITGAARRGKLMWLPLDDGRALRAHLGMSGQLLVRGTAAQAQPDPAVLGQSGPDLTATQAPTLVRDLSTRPRHLRVRLHLAHQDGDEPTGAALDLVDQRMFGGLLVDDLVPTADGLPGGRGEQRALIPASATHVARDLLDPHLDQEQASARLRASGRGVKTLLLDQGIVSGVGNIYADEGLWAACLHGRRRGKALGRAAVARLLEETAAVMRRALAVGGTSFDALYVNADGAPGFFARSLAVYGRAGQDCRRCGSTLRSEVVGGRSHVFCPQCQTRPRG